MKRIYTIAAVAVVLIVVFSAYSIFYHNSQSKVEKNISVPFPSIHYNYTVDPFNNTSGTMFTITFNITDFPGGSVELVPNVVIHSAYLPDNYAKTSSIFNLTRNSSYGISFTSSSLFVKTNKSLLYSGQEYGWTVQNGTLISAGGSVLQWNNNGIWPISPGKLVLPSGNYSVTDKVWFTSLQPSQAQLNVTYAHAWVNLYSLELNAWISPDSSLTLSNTAVY